MNVSIVGEIQLAEGVLRHVQTLLGGAFQQLLRFDRVGDQQSAVTVGNASLIGTSFRYGSPIMLLCSLYLIDEVLAIILFYRSEMTDGIGNP